MTNGDEILFNGCHERCRKTRKIKCTVSLNFDREKQLRKRVLRFKKGGKKIPCLYGPVEEHIWLIYWSSDCLQVSQWRHQLWFPKVLDLNVSLASCWHAYTPFQNDWDVSMKQCLFPQPDEKKKRNIYYHPELKIVYTFNKLAGYLKNVICFSDDVTLLFLDIASILQDSHKLHLSNKVKQLTGIGTACLDVVAIVSVVVSVCIFSQE